MDLSGNVKPLGRLPIGEGFFNQGLVRLGPKLYGVNGYQLFSIATDGRVTIEHLFGNEDLVQNPVAIPVAIGGALYGTTTIGGKYNFGAVYKFVP